MCCENTIVMGVYVNAFTAAHVNLRQYFFGEVRLFCKQIVQG